ncbi:MAG: glycosyltransferase family 2 protein [candidate division WOR-3 bacterium]
MNSSAGPSKPPQVAILTPVYNEEESLPLYFEAIRTTLLCRADYDFHVILIDDGSRDRSWDLIRAMCSRDARFEGIRLSRNYGSHIALSAGFLHARGDAVATLACDLQDPPEVILHFLAEWRKGSRIVWGKRRNRQDRWWRIWTSKVFAVLLRRFAMPPGSKFTTGSFLLVDKRVVECIRQFQEHNRIIFTLVAWTGFEQSVVEYDRKERRAGTSGWTFGTMLKTMYDGFVSFSTLPIRLMTWVGIGAFLGTLGLSVYLLVCWVTGNPAPGWTSIMLALGFFFGLQFVLMGVSGEYLSRIYTEAVRRPLFFISDRTPPPGGRKQRWTKIA